ncbi:Heavy metal-associated isoprenylated plant protein [Vigna angularis]|uniref:Heavy metal-associated isoprenylated plant protein n=1 Tax=Phaseolus angularis TaxID=3914 RepID=A0A8T0JS07_PHAAN|nr:Heavy metal-associated isoprenylated plant protein [Vigna angularis]
MAAGKEEKKKEEVEEITAIYKVNLHCKECGNKIKKHLMITQGVQSVEIEIEKGEVRAKGKIEPLKILKLIEKKSKKKVELISPKVKPKEITTMEKKPKEIKENVTVEGIIEVEKLKSFLRKRVHKNVEIVSIKEVKKEEKKGKEKDHGESTKKKDGEDNSIKKSGESTKEKGGESTKIIETREGHPKEDVKVKDNVPYIIHYVYAPQLFSDENPNSCYIL